MTDLRFTGKDIPKKLVNDLSYLADDLLGYDHTDKGFIIDMKVSVNEKTLASKLKVDMYTIEEQIEENGNYRYFIDTRK